jgi:hypothetical protein
MFDVMAMLRPVREKRIDQLEDLAERMLNGDAIPPELVDKTLREAGREPADLQAILDRRTRVRGLVAEVKRGVPAIARLQAIDAEIGKAKAAFDRARAELIAVEQRHAAEHSELSSVVRAADTARSQLLSKENLPPAAWERMVAAERAADDASNAHDIALRKLPDLRSAARWAAEQAKGKTDGSPYRGGRGFVSAEQYRAEATVAQKAFETAEASVPQLEKDRDAARRNRDATIADIFKAVCS